MNNSTPVSFMFLLIPFHDFCSLNTCLVFKGNLESVSGGVSGSGRLSDANFSFQYDGLIGFDILVLSPTVLCLQPICGTLQAETSFSKNS